MTAPTRKRAPGAGRPRLDRDDPADPTERHTLTMRRSEWAYLRRHGRTLSEGARVVVREHGARADRNRGVNMARDLGSRVAATDGRVYQWVTVPHDVIPRRYTITWYVRLKWFSAYVPDERSKAYSMSVDVDYTADEVGDPASVPENVLASNVEQLAAMLQEKIKQWEWEEKTAGLRITEVSK